jgi:hypothetical protein
MSTTPNILIAYASTHGQTALIASRIQESLERRDIHITLVNLKERPAPELYQFDGVILGASIIARTPACGRGVHQEPSRRAEPDAFGLLLCQRVSRQRQRKRARRRATSA